MIPLLAAGNLQSAALGLVTAIATLVIIGALKWGSSQLKTMYAKSHAEDERVAGERHKETMEGQALLHAADDRIEAHVLLTNGRVTELERKTAVITERQSHIEGQVEVLLREKGITPL